MRPAERILRNSFQCPFNSPMVRKDGDSNHASTCVIALASGVGGRKSRWFVTTARNSCTQATADTREPRLLPGPQSLGTRLRAIPNRAGERTQGCSCRQRSFAPALVDGRPHVRPGNPGGGAGAAERRIAQAKVPGRFPLPSNHSRSPSSPSDERKLLATRHARAPLQKESRQSRPCLHVPILLYLSIWVYGPRRAAPTVMTGCQDNPRQLHRSTGTGSATM